MPSHTHPAPANPGISKDVFRAAVQSALDRGVGAIEIAKEFEVNTDTVERWANGVNMPHDKAVVMAYLEPRPF